jgi:hypothetical protein
MKRFGIGQSAFSAALISFFLLFFIVILESSYTVFCRRPTLPPARAERQTRMPFVPLKPTGMGPIYGGFIGRPDGQ